MIAATFFSLLFVPTFFVIFQSLSEWNSKPKLAVAGAETTIAEAPEPEAEAATSEDEDDATEEDESDEDDPDEES